MSAIKTVSSSAFDSNVAHSLVCGVGSVGSCDIPKVELEQRQDWWWWWICAKYHL
jgi:hypothetical protein